MINMSFDLLCTAGKIGFYNRCKVIEIFLINKNRSISNLYTLVYFQEECFQEQDPEFLTLKPIKINNNLRLGIQKYYVSILEAKKRFLSLQNNKWLDVENKYHNQDTLNLIPKQFTSLTNKNRLNQILIKEDEIQSSYILEFFKADKKFSFDNNSKEFNKICDTIEKILGFKFNIIPERLGNFIFQFPVNLLYVNEFMGSKNNSLELSITWNEKLKEKPNGIVTVTAKHDDILLGNSTKPLKNFNREDFIYSNLSEEGIETTIYDLDNNLILYHDKRDYMYNFQLNAKVIQSKYRKFYVDDKLTEINLYEKAGPLIKRKPFNFNDDISRSVRFQKKIGLTENLSFKKYNKEHSVAIKDLQKLISENDDNGVYLWDPFLTAKDIFKTLYFSSTMDVPLKAITSRKVGKFDNLKEQFENIWSNNKNLKLEVRMQHKGYGNPFHDRFLIFPSNNIYEEPAVYSLGTSINSFGKDHHILQLVSFPDLIIDAFDELWDELDNEECILWKTF